MSVKKVAFGHPQVEGCEFPPGYCPNKQHRLRDELGFTSPLHRKLATSNVLESTWMAGITGLARQSRTTSAGSMGASATTAMSRPAPTSLRTMSQTTFIGPDGKTRTLRCGEVHEAVNCAGCHMPAEEDTGM